MQQIALTILVPVFILIFGTLAGLFFKGIDRKIASYFQARIGPKLRQPYYDIQKLMYKQTIVPENAVGWVFKGAPALAFASSAMLLSYIWMPYIDHIAGTSMFHITGDLILILYIIMIPGIALMAGGFASGSPYATVGAQRETVVLVSVELPLAVVFIAIAWQMGSAAPGLPAFSLSTIAANSIWSGLGPFGIIGGILLVLTYIAIIPAELAKIPFDQGEAKTEIADGLLAEYSGKYLAFFYLSEGLKALAICSLGVIIFFPMGVETLFGIRAVIGGYDYTPAVDLLFFAAKVLALTLVSITLIRVVMARLKITQAAKFFMITLTAMSLTGFVLMILDPILMEL